MGEAKQRAPEIDAAKNKMVQQKQQFDLMARMGTEPAVLVNSFHLAESSGLIRMALIDQSVPSPQYPGEVRVAVAMPLVLAKQMIDGLGKIVEFIESQAKNAAQMMPAASDMPLSNGHDPDSELAAGEQDNEVETQMDAETAEAAGILKPVAELHAKAAAIDASIESFEAVLNEDEEPAADAGKPAE